MWDLCLFLDDKWVLSEKSLRMDTRDTEAASTVPSQRVSCINLHVSSDM